MGDKLFDKLIDDLLLLSDEIGDKNNKRLNVEQLKR